MNSIIPKTKAKGIDICGVIDYYYIIRSDLGCYMQTSDLKRGSDISIFSLHPSCKDGDHYLGDWEGYFYIIKGNDYRRVTDLTTDSDAEVYSLHPNCQGGDHYLSAYSKFFIIFQEKGTYRSTSDMNQDSDAVEMNLHPNCRNGLYYWGMSLHRPLHTVVRRPYITLFLGPIYATLYTAYQVRYHNSFYFLKPVSKWGVEYYKGTGFNEYKRTGARSLHPDVLNFLPGGLSVTKGRAFGIWENIKTITNDSNTPVTWSKKITKKVGYNKEKMTQITHNWKMSMSASAENDALSWLIAKCQFSFSAEYGGSHVSTENESWNEMTEVEEQLTLVLKPNESLYLWQYRMGLGEETVLFCRDLKIDDDPNPPTEVPLPPAQS